MLPKLLVRVIIFGCLQFVALADHEPDFEAIVLTPGNLKELSDAAQENVLITPDNQALILPIMGSQRPFKLPDGEEIGELYVMRAMRTLVTVDAITDDVILKAFSSKERIVRCGAHLAFVARYGLDVAQDLGLVLREEPLAGGTVAAKWTAFCQAKATERTSEAR
jgi:hypothetical protein